MTAGLANPDPFYPEVMPVVDALPAGEALIWLRATVTITVNVDASEAP